MKKLLRISLFLSFLTLMSFKAFAQAPVPPAWIYGASPFQDSLWAIDTTTWQVVQRFGPTLPGFTITGITGMAYDPTTFQTYVIMKVTGVSGRVLGTIDLSTGVCTEVGNLGDNFSSITFHSNGQLYGATGNGANISKTLFLIDKSNADTTVNFAMGSGADGEIICFNRADTMIYHWSGNGTVVFEKFPASDTTYNPTNIVISGTTGNETFGAMYNSPTEFIISNISSNLRRCYTTGEYSDSILSNNPDDLRGLVMVPQFTISKDTICTAVETLYIGAGSLQQYDSVIYHWGDGVVEAMGTTGASHVYQSAGNYTVSIVLDNGAVRDTITSFAVNVLNIPNVSLTGDVTLCPGDSTVLTGSSGGTSQWYMNGAIIPGAITNTYTVTVPGVYNMIKYNLNGCGDSASVGLSVYSVPNPTVSIGPDTTACGSFVLDPNMINASSYLWSDGSTNSALTVTLTDTFYVTLADSNGCVGSDTAVVTILNLPSVSLAASSYTVCVADANVTLTGSPTGGTYSGASVTGSQFDPSIGAGLREVYYTYTDGNNCSATDTVTITVNTCTGIGEASYQPLNVYPNPTTGIIQVEIPGSGATIQVTDVLGKVVYTQQNLPIGKTVINLNENPAGIYFVVIKSGAKQTVSRLTLVDN